jgi:hypothetical protein
MLVRIVKDWATPDLNRQTPKGDGVWNGVKFTEERVRECDLLIVLNSPNRDIVVRCPSGNKWLLTQESPIEQYRWHLDSFQYFDRVFTFWDNSISPAIIHAQTALPWSVGRTYTELTELRLSDLMAAKRDRVSWVTSNATHKEGHKLRMALKDYLVEHDFDFDLFGRGFNPIDDKIDALLPYKYSIAIENYACDNYWTEKIADCFLSWTVPIYWGAKNIESFFPPRSMLRIDPARPELSLQIIRAALHDGYFEANLDALAEARDLVLNRHQFFPYITGLIAKFGVVAGARRTKRIIPVNPVHLRGEGRVARLRRLIRRSLQLP